MFFKSNWFQNDMVPILCLFQGTGGLEGPKGMMGYQGCNGSAVSYQIKFFFFFFFFLSSSSSFSVLYMLDRYDSFLNVRFLNSATVEHVEISFKGFYKIFIQINIFMLLDLLYRASVASTASRVSSVHADLPVARDTTGKRANWAKTLYKYIYSCGLIFFTGHRRKPWPPGSTGTAWTSRSPGMQRAKGRIGRNHYSINLLLLLDLHYRASRVTTASRVNLDLADLPVARDTTGKRENWAKHGFPESREIRESPVDQATR